MDGGRNLSYIFSIPMKNSTVKKIIDKYVISEENNDYLSYSNLHKAFSTEDNSLQKQAIFEKVSLLIATSYFRWYFTKDDLEDGRGVCDFGVNSISRELAFIEDFVGTANLERIVEEALSNLDKEEG